MKLKQGKLISFEGGEGSGKSVQIKRLQERLSKAGKKAVLLREPGGTEIGEQIRQVLLNPENKDLAEATEVLLFQAGRAQIYQEKVLPALQVGKIVLMDRTRDSSTIYQGIVRGFGRELIEKLNDISTQKTYPDLTLLLDVSVETGLRRRNGTKKMDRLDRETKEFHEQVRRGYLELAKKNGQGRWIIINGEKSVDEVAEQVWQAVSQRLDI